MRKLSHRGRAVVTGLTAVVHQEEPATQHVRPGDTLAQLVDSREPEPGPLPHDVSANGLAADHVVRAVGDVRGLHQMLDVHGRRHFGSRWDAEYRRTGRTWGETAHAALSEGSLTAQLGDLTRGGHIDVPLFTVNGVTASLRVTARMVDASVRFDRIDGAAEIGRPGETGHRSTVTHLESSQTGFQITMGVEGSAAEVVKLQGQAGGGVNT